MRRRRKWLGIPLEKRWQRRTLVCVGYALLFLSIFLRPMIFGPWPAHPHLSDYYPLWILIILFTRLHNTRAWQGDYFPDGWFSWTRRRSTALPPGAMDERELVLQHTAHLWAYYVLCSLISLGAVAYYSVGIVQKTLAPAMPFVMFYDLPLVFLSLPGAIAFWIEPDWLEESTREVAGSVEIAH